MGKIYQVVVHGLRGQKMTLDLCNTEEQFKSMTVRQLKEKLAQKLPETTGKTNKEALRLIFTDQMLDGDDSLLSDYGIQHMSVIHMVMKVPGGLSA
uniref:Ubiquitin-like domain-containing protein n=1 Tax=Amphilophus citrinellus TaxID=61819 RepID=A0A3Q0REB8_AMPCI